jgi:hypothetical protein
MLPEKLKAEADRALLRCRHYLEDAVDEVHAVLLQAGIDTISKDSLEHTLKSRQVSSDEVEHLKCRGRPLGNGGLGTVTAVTDAFHRHFALKVRRWHCAAAKGSGSCTSLFRATSLISCL